MPRFYYFGCIERAGHYMHSNPSPRGLEEIRALHDVLRKNPWGSGIDAGLCPPGKDARYQVEGRASVHHKDGWTALAFWDRSVDSRGGSNSVFLADAIHDFEIMMALARENFPEVLDRLSFAVVDASGDAKDATPTPGPTP
jgi:hypothetical protein